MLGRTMKRLDGSEQDLSEYLGKVVMVVNVASYWAGDLDLGDAVTFHGLRPVAWVADAMRRWGRIDILHYNVGVSIAGGDAPLQVRRRELGVAGEEQHGHVGHRSIIVP